MLLTWFYHEASTEIQGWPKFFKFAIVSGEDCVLVCSGIFNTRMIAEKLVLQLSRESIFFKVNKYQILKQVFLTIDYY